MPKLIIGVNDLATTHSKLAKEWNYTKNAPLLPSNIAFGSHQKVWWQCSKCKYEYQASVNRRTSMNSACPVCAGKIVLPGFNDLATTNPELVAEWHPTKNGDLTPDKVMPGSYKKVWWQCETCGHEWQAIIKNRRNGSGCPVCAGRVVKPGVNDLASLCPEIAKEWDYDKNGELTPQQITAGSDKKVSWKCSKGHSWKATIKDRRNGSGCPICNRKAQTSFAEQTIYFYLNQLTPAENRYMLNGKTEIDVYLPEYKIGIEYDGRRFHKGKQAKQREERKNDILKKAGITLFRVKEAEVLADCFDTDTVIYCNPSAQWYLNEVVNQLLNRLNAITLQDFKISVDVKRDRQKIYAQYK